MEFIKKNWIFILVALICLAGLVVVGLMCSSASGDLRGKMDECKKIEDYLEKVAKKRKKLNGENVELSNQNVEIAEKAVKTMEKQVRDKYSVKLETINETPIAAWKRLQSQVQELQDKVDAKPMRIDPSVEGFTFAGIIRANQPPHKDDLPRIFRLFDVVKLLMQVAMDSDVDAVVHLARPMGMSRQDESGYSFTPWTIDIEATPANAQKFVNTLTQTEGYLFMLKKIAMVSPDETTEAGKDLVDRLVSGGVQSRIGERRDRRGGMDGGEPGMDDGRAEERSRKSADDGLVEIPITRNELLVYKPKKTLWKLRFDLIEFNIAEEEAAEEKAE